MKNIFFFFAILFFLISAQPKLLGQASCDTLVMESDSIIALQITAIGTNSVTLEDGRTLNLNQLKQIRTLNRNYIHAFPKREYTISAAANGAVLYTFKIRPEGYYADYIINNLTAHCLYVTKSYENIELQLDWSFNNLDYFICQFAMAMGSDFSPRTNDGTRYSLGLGFGSLAGPSSYAILFNLGEGFFKTAYGSSGSQFTFFCSAYRNVPILDSPVYFSIGARYYIKDIEYMRTKESVVFIAGLGYSIK